MKKTYFDDQEFLGIDFHKTNWEVGEYDGCTFVKCNFPKGSLTGFNFTNCRFSDCDFSLVKVDYSSFQGVTFEKCNLLGIHFDACKQFLFAVNFIECRLNLASFYQMNLRNSTFIRCSLHEADFVETNLSGIALEQCDLLGATFDRSILEKTDFRSAVQYSFNPNTNRIKGAIFDRDGALRLLDGYQIKIE